MYPVIDNPHKYKAAIYARLSKEDIYNAKEESESIKNQIAILTDYANSQKLKIYDTYIDDGITGTTMERPDFIRLIDDINADNVNMVITTDMSRLTRNIIDSGTLFDLRFPENDVRYIAIYDGIDTHSGTSNNDMMILIKSFFNELHARDTSNKVCEVKHSKQQKGLFIGGKAPYGYKKSPTQKNVIVIDENVADIVRRIFSLAAEGISCRQIAMTLNEENIPTPAQYARLNIKTDSPFSGKWSSERIGEMLKNEVYIGNMVQGRVKKASYKSKKIIKIPREEWTVVENTHEAIIDKKTFEKANELIQSRTRTRHRTYDYPLKGLVTCKECGYPLATIKRKLAGNKDVLYFVCRTYQRFTKLHECTCHCVRVEDIENAVITEVRKVCETYLNYIDKANLTDKAQKELQAELRKQGKDKTALRTKLESIRAKIDSAYDDKLSGNIDNQTFQRIYTKLQKEEADTRTKLTKLEANSKEIPSVDEKTIEELIRRFMDSENYTRELFVSLIEKVELSENKELSIHFRFSELKVAEHL